MASKNSSPVDWEALLAGITRGKTIAEYSADRSIFQQGRPADSIFYARVIQDAADSLRPAAEDKGLAVDLDLQPSAGLIDGNANPLRQVFWNLLSNAVRFTPEGGRIQIALRYSLPLKTGFTSNLESVARTSVKGSAAVHPLGCRAWM